MPNVNTIMLIGHLGRDPEMKYSNEGKPYTKFSMATSRGKDERKVTTWYEVTCFGYWAEYMAQATKGQVAVVVGEHSMEKWVARDGSNRSTEHVIANVAAPLMRKEQREDRPAQRQESRYESRENYPPPPEEEIPF